jgi:hypothetical protein
MIDATCRMWLDCVTSRGERRASMGCCTKHAHRIHRTLALPLPFLNEPASYPGEKYAGTRCNWFSFTGHTVPKPYGVACITHLSLPM